MFELLAILVDISNISFVRLFLHSLASQSGAAPFTPTISINDHFNDAVANNLKKARVLYDYDAKDVTELSLMTDEVCFCSKIKKM